MSEKTKKELKIVKPWGEAEIENHIGRVGGRRNLLEVEVETDDGYLFSYLIKRPGKAVVQATIQSGKKKDYDKVQKIMLGCVLEGD